MPERHTPAHRQALLGAVSLAALAVTVALVVKAPGDRNHGNAQPPAKHLAEPKHTDQKTLVDHGNPADRIRPIGQVIIGSGSPGPADSTETVAPQPSAPATLATIRPQINAPSTAPEPVQPADSLPAIETGARIAASACAACHQTGVLDAPKVGDRSAWEPRLAQGYDVLLAHALEGFKGMPPKGGNPTLTDQDVENAVIYLLEQAGLSPDAEPKTPSPIKLAETSGVDSPQAEPPSLEDPVPEKTTQSAKEAADPPQEVELASITAAEPASEPKPLEPPASVASSSSQEEPVSAESSARTLYDQACASCHNEGTQNAPRLGDQSAWATRLNTGVGTLASRVADGEGGHPGATAEHGLSETEVEQTVNYIIERTFWPQ